MKKWLIPMAAFATLLVVLLLNTAHPVMAEGAVIQPYPPKTLHVGCSACGYTGTATVDAWYITETAHTYDWTCPQCHTPWTLVNCPHTWEDYGEEKATCTREGRSGYKVCTVCNARTVPTVYPVAAHDLETREAKAPTCTEVGWNAYQACKNCDYKENYQELHAGEGEGHTGGTANCTHGAVCDRCGQEYGDLNPDRHSGGIGYCQRGPICELCGTEYGQPRPGYHAYEITEVLREPGCLPGRAKRTCKVCGKEVESSFGTSTGHFFVRAQTDPTCEEAGWHGEQCEYCGEKRGNPIDPLGHELVHHDAQPPTCTESGWEAYDTCAREGCSYTTWQELPAGHDESGAAATCTAAKVCAREGCDAVLSPAQGHQLKMIPAKPATTAETGNVEYWHCETCDENFSDGEGQNRIELQTTEIAKIPPEIQDDADDGSETFVPEPPAVPESSPAETPLKETVPVLTEKPAEKPVAADTKVSVNSVSPKTGDRHHMDLWLAGLLVSIGILFAAGVSDSRNKKKKSGW